MRYLIVLISVILISCSSPEPQPYVLPDNFQLPITLNDGINRPTILVLGVDSAATNGYEHGLDIYAPPMPPAGGYGAYLYCEGEGYFKDIHGPDNEEWLIKYQLSTQGKIELNWAKEQFVGFKITYTVGGNFFSLDMGTVGSLEVEKAIENELIISKIEDK